MSERSIKVAGKAERNEVTDVRVPQKKSGKLRLRDSKWFVSQHNFKESARQEGAPMEKTGFSAPC
jgi:hypothetical protein